MARTFNLATKRFSLADLGEDWKDCYIEYRPMSTGDVIALSEMDESKLTESQSIKDLTKSIRRYFVSGKGSVIEDGQVSTVDLTAEDIDALPLEVVGDLFSEMSTGGLDPKALAPEVPQNSEPTNEAKPTETTSSAA